VSSSQELAIGQEGYGAVLAEYGQYDDKQLAAFVDSVGQEAGGRVAPAEARMALHAARRSDRQRVRDARRLHLHHARDHGAPQLEAQLAGVLGHEIGHVTARHTANRMTLAAARGSRRRDRLGDLAHVPAL
jgi:predicted Zn-dependent protease